MTTKMRGLFLSVLFFWGCCYSIGDYHGVEQEKGQAVLIIKPNVALPKPCGPCQVPGDEEDVPKNNNKGKDKNPKDEGWLPQLGEKNNDLIVLGLLLMLMSWLLLALRHGVRENKK